MSAVPVCAVCKKDCPDGVRGLDSPDMHYHRECFVCSSCGATLDDSFVSDGTGSTLLCETCFDLQNPSCPKCGEQLVGDVVLVEGTHYHHECFTCTVCGVALATAGHFGDSPEDWSCPGCHDKGITMCSVCGEKMSGKVVVIKGVPYHVGCAVCVDCRIPIAESAGAFIHENEGLMRCSICQELVTKNRPGAQSMAGQPRVEPPMDPLIQPRGEPVMNPLIQPRGEPVMDPLIQPRGEPVMDPLIQPRGEPVMDPLIQPRGEPVMDPLIQPRGEPVMDPLIQPRGEPVIESGVGGEGAQAVSPENRRSVKVGDAEPSCATCGTPVVGKRLRAKNDTFHPACLRCSGCGDADKDCVGVLPTGEAICGLCWGAGTLCCAACAQILYGLVRRIGRHKYHLECRPTRSAGGVTLSDYVLLRDLVPLKLEA